MGAKLCRHWISRANRKQQNTRTGSVVGEGCVGISRFVFALVPWGGDGTVGVANDRAIGLGPHGGISGNVFRGCVRHRGGTQTDG